jgi:hypothetical protein
MDDETSAGGIPATCATGGALLLFNSSDDDAESIDAAPNEASPPRPFVMCVYSFIILPMIN